MSKRIHATVPIALAALVCLSTAHGERVVSDGSDGPFHPTASQTIDLATEAPDGVFNFTTIHIPAGVTIRFTRNATNTPVFFAATGDVVIAGTIELGHHGMGRGGGPGGWNGGLRSQNGAADDGDGPAGGQGGPPPVGQGNAGGGGGMATAGLVATARTGGSPGAPGGALAKRTLVPGLTGGGGSGGGGGGGRLLFGVDIPGGDGGGGAGALQISTLAMIDLSGTIRADGAHGGVAFANVFAHGGPGGGGAGGNVEFFADTVTIRASAVLHARGGAGGGLSTEPVAFDPWFYTSGAHGGDGYFMLAGNSVAIDPNAVVTGVLLPVVFAGADLDLDADVDFDDADQILACVAGPDLAVTAPCLASDLDGDLDADVRDLRIVQACFAGTNVPVDGGCASMP
jgi:hypothetical protein